MSTQNVYFLGVARIAGNSIVVASFSYNTDTDIGGVKQVLDQPNMNMQPGKHYTFSSGQFAWHLIAGKNNNIISYYFYSDIFFKNVFGIDDLNLIYILICAPNYPQRCAHACLEELQSNVSLLF
jgi:hypothetical protein